jgi:hypothetical protein
MKINSTSDSTAVPSEIGFNRRSKNALLATAMGVSGDTERGAFWWAGGADRININYETGVVRIKHVITTPTIHMNVIRGSTAEQITIQENVVINVNLTVNGTTSSDWIPFWCAGKVNGAHATVITSKGRVGYSMSKVCVGTHLITFNTAHPDDSDYIVNTTAQTYHTMTRTGTGFDPTNTTFQVVVINSSNALSDISLFCTVLA